MPIEQVTRAVAIDKLAICVSAWRWICDCCGDREVFHDNPMPEGCSELDPSRKGWRLWQGPDEQEMAKCPSCCKRSDDRIAAALNIQQRASND